jgi:IS4 transposase
VTQNASSAIMTTIRKALPRKLVNSLARTTGAVKRQGKVDIYKFILSLVLGFAVGDKRTLASLRRSYEKAARHTIEESAFYKRFSVGLVALLKGLVARAFEDLVGAGRALEGALAQFRDVMLTDSTVVRLHELLAKTFPACRTNHTQAALKAHVILSVRGVGGSSVKVTPERAHDGPVFRVGRWVKDHLLLFDLGYFRYQLFDRIAQNGGFFVTRLKKNVNPVIVSANRRHRGKAVKVEGQHLRDVLRRLGREVLDVNVEVQFPRRAYAGRTHRDRRKFRVVGIRNAETREYHLYITNLPANRLPAEDVGIVYSLRWQIELLFKELKTHYRLEDMPSRKAVVVEALLYAAMLTLVVSRRVLAVVREHTRLSSDRLPAHRWAALFVSVAHDLLHIILRGGEHGRRLLRDLTRVLVHEAVDPNRKRHGLLRAVETGQR